MHHMENIVIFRSGDQQAQYGEGQHKDRNAGSQGSQRGPFLGQKQLDLIYNDIVRIMIKSSYPLFFVI
jgi:hypothetical protein